MSESTCRLLRHFGPASFLATLLSMAVTAWSWTVSATGASASELTQQSDDGQWRIVLAQKPGVTYKPHATMSNVFQHVDAWVESTSDKRKVLVSRNHGVSDIQWLHGGARVVLVDLGSVYMAEAPDFRPTLVYKASYPKDWEYWSSVEQIKVAPNSPRILFAVTGGGVDVTYVAAFERKHVVLRLIRSRCPGELENYDLDSEGRVVQSCLDSSSELPLWCRRMTDNGIRIVEILSLISERYPDAMPLAVFLSQSHSLAVVQTTESVLTASVDDKTKKLTWNDPKFHQLANGAVQQDVAAEIMDLAMDGTVCTGRAATAQDLLVHEKWLWMNRRLFELVRLEPMPDSVLPAPLPDSSKVQIELEAARDVVLEVERQAQRDPREALRAWCKLARILPMYQGKLIATTQCTRWNEYMRRFQWHETHLTEAVDVVKKFLQLRSKSLEERQKICSDFVWAFAALNDVQDYQRTKALCSNLNQSEDLKPEHESLDTPDMESTDPE